MEKFPRLHQLAIEDQIIDHGVYGFIANYHGSHFDGSSDELDVKIDYVQELLTDIELGLRKRGIKLDPIGEHHNG